MFAHPVPSHIYPWKAAPLDKGRFQIRTKLNVTRLFDGQISGSESVTMAPDGRFIMLDRYGAVKEAQEQGGQLVLAPQPIAHLGPGRPLGAQFDTAGNLIICDAFKGLIMLEAGTNRVVILANRGLPKGRLQAYYPANRTTHVISHAFYYSNGVALSADGTYAAVCETDRLRLLKVWLPPHPRAGFSEVLIDGLPGTPDGISRSRDGNAFWVSLVSNIPPSSKWFGPALVRALLARIPENRRPHFPTWGAVLKVSDQEKVLQWLVDLEGKTAAKIPSAHEEGSRLYFDNLAGEYVSYINLADLPPDGSEVNEA